MGAISEASGYGSLFPASRKAAAHSISAVTLILVSKTDRADRATLIRFRR